MDRENGHHNRSIHYPTKRRHFLPKGFRNVRSNAEWNSDNTNEPQKLSQPVSLPNFLYRLRNPPDHLVSTVQRNATKSPLLRLPAELRHMIWHHALSSHELIIIESSTTIRVSVKSPDAKSDFEPQSPSILPPAYFLSGVCRQTYLETRNMVFKLNAFNPRGLWTVHSFAKALSLDQLKAVREMVFNPFLLHVCFAHHTDGVRLTSLFPNLRKVEVLDSVVRIGRWEMWFGLKLREGEEVRAGLERAIGEREGEGVVVVFREPVVKDGPL